MTFKIENLRRAPDGGFYTSPERLYITADGELCEEFDARAAFLLVSEGGRIPATEAARYGLVDSKQRKPDGDKQREPDGDKASPSATPPAATPDPKPSEGPKSLSKMNRGELVALAEEAGLDASGTNAELAERIRAARKANKG